MSLPTVEPSPEPTNVERFTLTAYTSDCEGCIGITAAGIDVRNTIHYVNEQYSPKKLRIVAVDPDVVPMWSVLRVTFANGRTIEVVALDIGSAIDGRDIDLLVGSRARAFEIGRQGVEVEIIENSKGDD
jgi:3D (Asp-Asp-Asp) domain-containing protein